LVLPGALHWHIPLKQLLPVPHELPHVPQLAGSNAVTTQVPLQSVWKGWHIGRHIPKLQTWLDVQALPQLPQLAGSCCRRTHVFPHFVNPAWHVQLELMQVPLVHAALQLPQLLESDAGLMQMPPQRMKPLGHALWHTPAEHV
jgi:hypothetical protein